MNLIISLMRMLISRYVNITAGRNSKLNPESPHSFVYHKWDVKDTHLILCVQRRNTNTPSHCQPDPQGKVFHRVFARFPHVPAWCWSGICCGCENCVHSCLKKRERKKRMTTNGKICSERQKSSPAFNQRMQEQKTQMLMGISARPASLMLWADKPFSHKPTVPTMICPSNIYV